MYLREALMQCRDLESEVAHVYEELAALHSSDKKLSRSWERLARDERLHARILAALLAAEEVGEDDGPFVVDLRSRITALRKLVDRAYQAVRRGIEPEEAIRLAEAIETSEIDALFAEVIELARPSLDKLVAIVDKGEVLAHRHQRRVNRLRSRAETSPGASSAGSPHPVA
ncbi:MAG: hypothetical protein D6760_04760 [Deltaproteobacteria bacterium]|nr:MAG: hypothetical protein D6760_04760 [Deltaproteobacteria bacterium]